MKLHALEKFIEATETLLAFDLAHEADRSEATSRERFYLELSQRCWELRAGNFRWMPSFQKRQ